MAVAAVLAALLLYYSVRGIDWSQVGRTIAHASIGLLAAVLLISSSTLFLRALRWRILLNAAGEVGVTTVFWATAVGLFGNNLLPARAGELVRTLMIDSQTGLGKAYVLATALCEKVADALVLILISAIVLLALSNPPGWLAGAARPMAIVAALGAMVIVTLPLIEPVLHRVIQASPMPDAWRVRLISGMQGGLQGLRAFHDLRRLSAFLALTLVIWLVDAVGTVIGGAALGFRIPIVVAFLLFAGLGVGSALPSTPGYVGIYQFVAVSVLTPFGFSRTDAIAYILVAQTLFFVVICFWGSLGLWSYRRRQHAN